MHVGDVAERGQVRQVSHEELQRPAHIKHQSTISTVYSGVYTLGMHILKRPPGGAVTLHRTCNAAGAAAG